MKYRVIIGADQDGVFVAECPSLPGCISQGSTRDEATESIAEAISGYLESLEARGEPIPPRIEEEIIEIPCWPDSRPYPAAKLSGPWGEWGTVSIASGGGIWHSDTRIRRTGGLPGRTTAFWRRVPFVAGPTVVAPPMRRVAPRRCLQRN